jgi:hypothetical protein
VGWEKRAGTTTVLIPKKRPLITKTFGSGIFETLIEFGASHPFKARLPRLIRCATPQTSCPFSFALGSFRLFQFNFLRRVAAIPSVRTVLTVQEVTFVPIWAGRYLFRSTDADPCRTFPEDAYPQVGTLAPIRRAETNDFAPNDIALLVKPAP